MRGCMRSSFGEAAAPREVERKEGGGEHSTFNFERSTFKAEPLTTDDGPRDREGAGFEQELTEVTERAG